MPLREWSACVGDGMEKADNLGSGCCGRGSVGTILDDGVHERYLVDGDVNGDGVLVGWLQG